MDIYTVLLLVGMAVMSLAKYRENYVCTNFRSACATWALQGWCDVPTYWTRYYCCHSCHYEATGCPNGQTRNHEGECQEIKKNNPGLTSATVPPKEISTTIKTTMTTTDSTTAATILPTHSEPIDGICPDTDRSLETLPGGKKRLMDRKSADGPWTVIQRRIDGSVNFDRNWTAYESGFGSKSSSFWLGLREIHNLCNEDKKCQLLINLKFSGMPNEVVHVANGCYHASYSEFWLSGPTDYYVLTISGYGGTAGDCLNGPSNPWLNVTGHAFSTKDGDHDSNNSNCARSFYAGWWFTSCSYSCLNARFDDHLRFLWLTLTGYSKPLEFAEMKVRSKM